MPAIKFTIEADASKASRAMMELQKQSAIASGAAVNVGRLATYKQGIQESKAAVAEMQRYQTWLESNASGLATVSQARDRDSESVLRSAAAWRKLNASRLEHKAETSRYGLTSAGGAIGARNQNEQDHVAWQKKLAAAKGITVEQLKTHQLIREQEIKSSNAAQFAKEKAYRERKAGIMGAGGAGVGTSGFRAFAEGENEAKSYAKGYSTGLSSSSFNVSGSHRKWGAKGVGGASSAMFVSVARDSAASLASGMNPMTVFLQQAPQVLQAMTMMRLGWLAIAAVGVLAAAIATHFISKWVADTVYGIAKQERLAVVLEMQRQRLRALVDSYRAVAAAARTYHQQEQSFEDDRIAAMGRLRDARREAYKQELEAKNNKSISQGGSDNSSGIARMVLVREKEDLQATLSEIEEQGLWGNGRRESDKTSGIRDKLDKLNAIPSTKLMPTDYAEMFTLSKQLESSTAADAAETETRLLEVKNKIAAVDNQLSSSGNSPESTPSSKTSTNRDGSALPITENQRVGAYIGGPSFTMIDIARKHLTVAQQTYAMLKAGGSGGRRGVHFGGNR